MVCYGESLPAGYSKSKLGSDCNDEEKSQKPTTIWHLDGNSDGYYTGSGMTSCTKPRTSYWNTSLLGGGNCDDGDAAVNPVRPEIFGNGVDDNCTGQVDEVCITCGNAMDLTTSGITSNSATLNWTAAADPEQWQVQYKPANPCGRWTDLAVVPSIRSVTLTGLKQTQDYSWHMRAKCKHAWKEDSFAASFTTLFTKGKVSVAAANTMVNVAEEKLQGDLQVKVLPNPSTQYFTLLLASAGNTPVTLQVSDASGRVLEVKSGLSANSALQIGQW